MDDLRDQQRMLNDDLSSAQVRWHTVREEKIKATNVLQRRKKAEDDLVALAEEKEHVTMEKKVLTGFPFFNHYFCWLPVNFFVPTIMVLQLTT